MSALTLLDGILLAAVFVVGWWLAGAMMSHGWHWMKIRIFKGLGFNDGKDED